MQLSCPPQFICTAPNVARAADAVTFAPDLSFQSRDGLPSVLRLGDFARVLMGQSK